jgi:TPR repeat protein
MAEYDLGVLYRYGLGVSKDYTQAGFWLRKAAKQDHVAAQVLLGELYFSGHGVPQDYAEAYFWFNIAASKNLTSPDGSLDLRQDVEHNRDAAAVHLSAADLSRTQERARKWFEDHAVKP